MSAKKPALVGAATLVPPNAVQPPAKNATTPPADGSLGYEMSGTARLASDVNPFWKDGLLQTAREAATPGARVCGRTPRRMMVPSQSFHTDCDDAERLGRLVPPTLTTSGWDPGSSTASDVLPLVGAAVLGSRVTRGGDDRLALQRHTLEDLALVRGCSWGRCR